MPVEWTLLEILTNVSCYGWQLLELVLH